MAEDGIVSDRSSSGPRSESKGMVGEKWSGDEFNEESKFRQKRVKMRDLHSVVCTEGIDTHYPKSTEIVEASCHLYSVEKEKFQEVSKNAATTYSDIAQAETIRNDPILGPVNCSPRPLDLNTEVCLANDSAGGDLPACPNEIFLTGKHEHGVNFATSRGFGWDLNAEDVSSSLNPDPFYPYKKLDHLRSGDASECGSTTGSLEERDSMRVWKEMKQNGFLSSSHGGIPAPKPRGRKSKSDGVKKKMEIARREQIDRFAKIAAPSGLLNDLNPGIINHVRNSRQVHSIIEALVRSEKHENHQVGGKQSTSTKDGAKEPTERKKGMENVTCVGTNQLSVSREDGTLSTLSMSHEKRGFPTLLSKSVQFNSDQSGRDGAFSKLEERMTTYPPCLHQDRENDVLKLNLSSSRLMVSENTSSLSNEDSSNLTGVSSLSVKAANVASQWLELLHQDIKGRLAALRRSKKRVRAVIQTELPFLMTREFASNQENDPYIMKSNASGCSGNANADAHRARWTALFDQMDNALSEEEKQLESWLNQVKEMQLHCERGLQYFNYGTLHGSQQLETLESDSRSEVADSAERELVVRAAAASIYSTCNFLLSAQNR